MAIRQVILKFDSDSIHTKADSAVLDATNWGNGITDNVQFTDSFGLIMQFYWQGVLYVRESNVPPPPPIPPPPPDPLPNWVIGIRWVEDAGSRLYTVSPVVKDQILADTMGPGSEDRILTFDTFASYRMRIPTKALACIDFKEQT